MKPQIKASVLVLTLTLAFAEGMPSRASLMEMLKGDNQPVASTHRRVAVVGSAVVKQVEGTVMMLEGVDRWTPLKVGARVKPGDLLRTHTGSAILRMEESGSLVHLRSDTVLRFAPLEREWDRASLTGIEHRNGFIVRRVQGSAYVRDGSLWRPIAVDSVLRSGSVVRTDDRGTVDIYSADLKMACRIASSARVRLSADLLAKRMIRQPALASTGK